MNENFISLYVFFIIWDFAVIFIVNRIDCSSYVKMSLQEAFWVSIIPILNAATGMLMTGLLIFNIIQILFKRIFCSEFYNKLNNIFMGDKK